MHAVILELANEYNIPEKNVLAIDKLDEEYYTMSNRN